MKKEYLFSLGQLPQTQYLGQILLRRLLLLLLFLTFITSFLHWSGRLESQTVIATGANLISNPSVAIAGTEQMPLDWFQNSYGNNSAVFSYPVAGMDDDKALRVELSRARSGDAKWYFADVPVKPGYTYYFSDYYRANVASELVARYTLNDNSYYYVYLLSLPSSKKWRQAAVEFRIPAKAKAVTIFHLIEKVGWLETDNFVLFSLLPVPPSPSPTPDLTPLPTPSSAVTPTPLISPTNSPPPTATPTPVPTIMPTPVPTSTPDPTPTTAPSPTEEPEPTDVTPTPEPEPTPVVSLTPEPSPTPEPTIEPEPSQEPEPTLTPIPQPTPTDLPTPSPEPPVDPSPTLAPEPTPTPSAEATPTPTLTPTPTPDPNTGNLIANAGLETSGDGSSPDYWLQGNWGNNTAVFSYPLAGDNSERAARVELTSHSDGDAKWYFQEVSVTPHASYLFSNRSQASVPSHFVVQYNDGQNNYSYQYFYTAPASTDWQSNSFAITVPDNVTALTVFHLIQEVGYLAVDNFSLVATTLPPTPTPTPEPSSPPPTPTPTTSPEPSPTPSPSPTPENSLVLNYSLEDSNDGLQPDHWLANSWGNNNAVFTYPVAGQHGAKAAQVTVSNYSDGDAKWYFADVAVTAGATYQFGDSYQADVSSSYVVRYQDEEGQYSYSFLATVPPASSWQEASVEFTVPLNVVSLTIFHLLADNGTLTIDNARLVQQLQPAFERGLVSLDFDDGWLSAYYQAIPILNAAGLKSTQYIMSGFLNEGINYVNIEQVLAMQAAGHEIGGHTITHAHLPELSEEEMIREIWQSKFDLESLGVSTLAALAYPYGEYNQAIIGATIDAGYLAGRTALGVDSGFNFKNTNRYRLKTFSMEADTDLAYVKNLIDTVALNKGWLILVFHQVDNNGGQYSVTPAFLQQVADYLNSADVSVVTVSQGLQQMAN